MTSFAIPNYGFDTGNSGLGLNFGTGAPGLMAPTGATSSPSLAPIAGSGAGGFQLGLNVPTLQMGLSGLNSLGNIWGAFQAQGLARDQLNFTRNVTNANLNNSIQSYNTALADRARARGAAEGQSQEEINNYVASNRLSR